MDTAARLRLSRRQYYRERRIICIRVSRALAQVGSVRATRFEIGDPLRLLMARAEALLDQGFGAVRWICWAQPGRASPRGSPDRPCNCAWPMRLFRLGLRLARNGCWPNLARMPAHKKPAIPQTNGCMIVNS